MVPSVPACQDAKVPGAKVPKVPALPVSPASEGLKPRSIIRSERCEECGQIEDAGRLLVGCRAACSRRSRRFERARGRPRLAFGRRSSQAAQQAPETFLQATRRALAQGRAAEAESLAKATPGQRRRRRGRAGAAGVVSRASTTKRAKLLEAAVAAQPAGEAALELGLLHAASVRRGRRRGPASSTAC